AEQSGGRLVLTSRPGEGTTAELWLPVTRAESVSASPEPAQHPAGTRSLAILTVDDDPLVLTSTAGMLEDLGHRVHEATSAAMAL
ncbi:hybrid sensor histidine kinase/response regulator, partial [Acinetobacter baumannii]